MNKPQITVATVCYNSILVLEESIQSVIHQTYCNIEYIIIDGGSTDGTIQLLERYKKNISYYISEPDKGIYDAMNKALDVATGDFVIFLGSDDHLMDYNVIYKVAELISNWNWVYYGDVYRNTRNDIYKGRFNKFKISLENICHQSIFYPKLIYKKYKYNLSYCIYADYYYNLNIFPITKFKYLPLTISYYNYEGTSSSAKDPMFDVIVDKFVRKQNGILAFLLRKIYRIYKKIK